MSINDLLPQSLEDKFLDTKYGDRHEKLKPIITKLYLGNHGTDGKKMTQAQIVDFMRDNYSFIATATQYKNWFKKWNLRRSTRTQEKNDVVNALSRRKRPLESSANVTLGEGENQKALDRKQMKRHLKDHINHYQVEAASPGIISMWNLPYPAFVASIKRPGQPSPFTTTSATPDYLNIASPGAPSPGLQTAGPSPTIQLVNKKLILDRSNLLIQGRHIELLQSCRKEEQVILTDYLHDFYMHSFVTAKYWGKGPTSWTWGMISALTLGGLDPPSPVALSGPGAHVAAASPGSSSNPPNYIKAPSNLCRWVIHVEEMNYEPIHEPPVDEPHIFDVEDPSSWRQWTNAEHMSASILNSMQDTISRSSFSGTRPKDLPVSNQLIAQSLQKSPAVQLVETWKFAIMAGNMEAIELISADNGSPSLEDFYPFHLAAYFLDGGNKCCSVVSDLVSLLPERTLLDYPIDGFGHTIYDSFIVSILRSHTRLSPGDINPALAKSNAFPGEEKDICGRWDADSPEIRHLFRQGYARIPTKWKHPFCHSAVQAVYHSIISINRQFAVADINELSGLFSKRCISCGLELKLGPIHSLVLMAFHLAQHGIHGETLFGAITLILCLIRLGAKLSLKAAISIKDIFHKTDSDMCRHNSMNAYEFLMSVPETIVAKWSNDCKIGWKCIREVLLLGMRDEISEADQEATVDSRNSPSNASQSPRGDDTMESSEHLEDVIETCWKNLDVGVHGIYEDWSCGNAKLGLLWAMVQTELLTYRRIKEKDSWISPKFSTKALLAWLEGKSGTFDTPLVKTKMMKESHSRCGWFKCDDFTRPIASDVCTEYFMNMDVYSRASYLPRISRFI